MRSRKRLFEETMVKLFASPNIPKTVIENKRFKDILLTANPSLDIPTVKTLNSRLWKNFVTRY